MRRGTVGEKEGWERGTGRGRYVVEEEAGERIEGSEGPGGSGLGERMKGRSGRETKGGRQGERRLGMTGYEGQRRNEKREGRGERGWGTTHKRRT